MDEQEEIERPKTPTKSKKESLPRTPGGVGSPASAADVFGKPKTPVKVTYGRPGGRPPSSVGSPSRNATSPAKLQAALNNELEELPATPQRQTRSPRKRKRSPSPALSDMSALSSLSATPEPEVPQPKTPKKQRVVKAKPSTKNLKAPSTPQPQDVAVLSEDAVNAAVEVDTWNIDQLQSNVFVFLDMDGHLYDPEETRERLCVWWPAKIEDRTNGVLKLKVYEPPKSDKALYVQQPSAKVIVNFNNSLGRPRFDEAPFIRTHPSSKAFQQKRVKFDLSVYSKRWASARQQAISNIMHASEGLPSSEFALHAALTQSDAKPAPKTRKKKKDSSPPADEPSSSSNRISLSPPAQEADSMLSIPGEGVYAKERKEATIFWPAQVLEYIPPATQKQKEGRYRVMFLDKKEKLIPRSWFFHSGEPGFASCKGGDFESNVMLEVDDEEKVELERGQSPEPAHPAPNPQDFIEQDIRVQFAYIKPIMKAILDGKYKPSQWRHEKFMAGGKKRNELSKLAASSGLLSAWDVDMLARYLNRWCLGETKQVHGHEHDDGQQATISVAQGSSEGPQVDVHMAEPSNSSAEVIVNGAEKPSASIEEGSATAHDSYPKQTGCADYESLSDSEKSAYCANILLPEAKIQILLWHNGDRITTELLDDEQEEALNNKGREHLNKTYWVWDILRLKKFAEARLKAKAERLMPSPVKGSHDNKPNGSRSERARRRG